MTRPPVEVLHLVIAAYVSEYIYEMFGPHSGSTIEGDDGEQEGRVRSVLPLLLASYQFRQITLGILSRYTGVPLDEAGERLDTPPWPPTFDVYAVLSTQFKSGMVLTKAVSLTGSPPAVALCMFAKASLQEIRRRRRMSNVSTLTFMGDPRWDHHQDIWENSLRDALDACGIVPLGTSAMHALRQCAQDTLTKAIVVKRYAILISRLVSRMQHLCRLRTDISTMQHERFVLLSLMHLLGVLHRVDEDTREDRTCEARAAASMPETEDISDLCSLAQRVVDLDMPESDVLTDCKTLARNLKDEWEQQLSRMREVMHPTAMDSVL